MDRVIEDMARAMCNRGGDGDYGWVSYKTEAKAALATLPEFIVLDEDAEVEVGDVVEFEELVGGSWIKDCTISTAPKQEMNRIYRSNRIRKLKIIQRNGIQVLTRNKEDNQ